MGQFLENGEFSLVDVVALKVYKGKMRSGLSLEKVFLGMLGFIPLAILGWLFRCPSIWLMLLTSLAIIPLSKYIGQATESLASYLGPALGGILNVTFGNATELIIGILALRHGLTEVVKASITGSILGNLLLVTGSAIFLAGWKYKKLQFNKTAALASASTLLLAVVSLAVPAFFYSTAPGIGRWVTEELSVAVAILILVAYLGNLFFMLRTHKHLYGEAGKEESPSWNWQVSAFILLASTVAVSFLSEVLVTTIEPVVHSLGWTELFIGVIFIAIIGNAAEHTTAITMAIKNKMDLALQITLGSATQIAMLVAPVLVLASLLFERQLGLVFRPFELVTITLAVLVTNLIVEDGEAHWFEGLQLLIAYGIMAVAFFLHP